MRAAEHARLRELRLAALAGDPAAFGSTHAREAARPAAWWERWAARSQQGTDERTFVVEDDGGRWLGIAFVRLEADRPGRAWLGGMWVSPAARRGGAAARLCTACAAWARERGAEELTLTVVVGNDAARRVYERAGFTVGERLTGTYDGRTLDEHAMARPLHDDAAPESIS